MKHMKTVEVPASTKEIINHVSCDICKATISQGGCFDVDEVEVRHRTGVSYPEGGRGEEINLDICGKCFDEKLVPFLESLGADVEAKDWDW